MNPDLASSYRHKTEICNLIGVNSLMCTAIRESKLLCLSFNIGETEVIVFTHLTEIIGVVTSVQKCDHVKSTVV